MNCRNCPYVKDEFEKRMNWYQLENNIYKKEYYQCIQAEEELCCWCEKTGGKLWWYGQCGDADITYNNIKHKNSSKHKRRNKRERDLKYKQHLKYLAKNCNYHPSPAYPVDKNGRYYCKDDPDWLSWFPEYESQEFAYYKRQYRSAGKRSASNYHKKMSNRKIRRYKGDIPSGFWCHKLYDYWWEMY